jgi:SAM-dependent methyltransferase
MVILNLGCGTKTTPYCVNIDWSIFLKVARSRTLSLFSGFFFTGDRLKRLRQLDKDILVHDLRRGIPSPDASADAVYHSHVLEHIDRGPAERFLTEVRRVLKPDGIHRVVVPDLELLARDYLDGFTDVNLAAANWEAHDSKIAAMIEQMVRREASGTSHQKPLRRKLENLLLGDARKRAETHQWMYDRVNLCGLLQKCGFRNASVAPYNESRIPNRDKTGSGVSEDGLSEYKPMSLYVECLK